MFSWQKPDPGVIKLNVDGSRVDASGRIGAGEVLDPEIWGLYSGFKLASENNSAKLIIESDFAILVNLWVLLFLVVVLSWTNLIMFL